MHSRRWIIALVTLAILLIAIEPLIHKHGHFSFENRFGFHAIFGFIAFTVAVFAGKCVRALLSRDEDYYDR